MANLNLNKVILVGHLTAAPELRATTNGVSVVRFTVAVNRHNSKGEKPQADFIRVVAWRQTAEFIARYFGKGSSICICGSVQTYKYKGNDGNDCFVTEIVADEANFVDSRTDTPHTAQTPANATCNSPSGDPAGVGYPQTGGNYTEIGNDEDLPF